MSAERARGECYRLLAACFYPPQIELWLEERLLENLTGLLDRVCSPAAGHARRMQEEISGCSAEELMVEYARLFVGPQRVIAPPYGSVYLEEGRRVMGDSTQAALRAYREAALRLDSDFKELPDHITVELEFMYFLTAQAIQARNAGETSAAAGMFEIRRAFLDRLLRPWMSEFCTRIREGTEYGFYRALADCLSEFIQDPA